MRRLLEVADDVEGPFARAAALQARSLAQRDVEGLRMAGEQFQSSEALGEAADAFAQGSTLAKRSGNIEEARRLANRAATIADAQGIVSSPALRAVLSGNPLTRRQREIALLAARGLSNRAIAEQMVISVRTVESHLDAAYRRLGITGRGELCDALPLVGALGGTSVTA
jgi:DNA-binding NarL/FixJ family response regulator